MEESYLDARVQPCEDSVFFFGHLSEISTTPYGVFSTLFSAFIGNLKVNLDKGAFRLNAQRLYGKEKHGQMRRFLLYRSNGPFQPWQHYKLPLLRLGNG